MGSLANFLGIDGVPKDSGPTSAEHEEYFKQHGTWPPGTEVLQGAVEGPLKLPVSSLSRVPKYVQEMGKAKEWLNRSSLIGKYKRAQDRADNIVNLMLKKTGLSSRELTMAEVQKDMPHLFPGAPPLSSHVEEAVDKIKLAYQKRDIIDDSLANLVNRHSLKTWKPRGSGAPR